MALDLERVRQELLTEYNINIAKDDPMLMFLASHELVLKQYSEHIETSIAKGLEHYETTALDRNQKLLEGANETANRILQNALEKSLVTIEQTKKKEEEEASTVSSNNTMILIFTAINTIICAGLFSFLVFFK